MNWYLFCRKSSSDDEDCLNASDTAIFKVGITNGYYIVNRSFDDPLILEVGTRGPAEHAYYSDVDLTHEKLTWSSLGSVYVKCPSYSARMVWPS